MKKLFKPELFKTLLFIFTLLLFVKIAWFVVEILFLPTVGINKVETKNVKGLYYGSKSTKLVNEEKEVIVVEKQPTVVNKNQGGNIKDITLMAVYHSSSMSIVTVSYKKKTKVLSKKGSSDGDVINGFMLEGAGNNFATFSKDEKTYKIFLTKIDAKGIRPSRVSTSIKKKTLVSKSKKTKASGKIKKVGDHLVVDRSLVDHYAKNMKDIFKDIGIIEVRKGGGVKGFRISFVRRGSKFAKLGLRRGDVITGVNGQAMNNYGVALGIYKEIDTIENLTLVIKRGNKEMELEYEIN